MVEKTPGSTGYTAEVDDLFIRYEAIEFDRLHKHFLEFIPSAPARILDIGSGTGRDAAVFASRGHRVVTAEPTTALRQGAMTLHSDANIEWLDDSLPLLEVVRDRNEQFDLIMLTAMWMHLDRGERHQAMPVLSNLTAADGHLCFTIRHGPTPAGRLMYDVDVDETVGLGEAAGLTLSFREDRQPSLRQQPGVTWSRLAFHHPG